MELCPILCNLIPRASYRFEGDQRSMFEFILVVSNSYASLINRWYANAWFNSTCYHPPPGHTPGDLQFFSHLAVYSPPPGTQKETIPHPRDSSSTTNTLFCSKTRRFGKNFNYFLEFIERRTLYNKNMNTIFENENWRKSSNRTGIRLASKEMFFATCFILNLAHTHKRPVNKLMAAFYRRGFLSLFHKNTGLRSLFNIKPCVRFYIKSIL